MTNKEAIEIIRKEYLCVDRDCDIDKSCGKCDLMMPSKEPILEAYKVAIKALEQEPCEDAISREKAKQFLYERLDRLNDDELYDIFSRIIDDMYNELPSVTPQQKTGHWITWKEAGNEIASETRFECSVCHDSAQTLYNGLDLLSPYCPNCGARMIEPQESETWNGIHAQITAPKGTFERIFNEADDDNDI